MQFQVVSHACLSVEAAGIRLLIDPWIEGPVYWGSWWHWPDPVFGPELFEADFIYLTHWHFDHFHAESLGRFDKRAHVLVPRFPVSTLVEQLRALGFTRITELKQAERFELAAGISLTSYQVQYQDDSIAVVEGEGTVLVDLNDAKPLPSTWKLLRRRHPRVDFMLRSHSPAWSYPTCYSFEDPDEAIHVSRSSYVDAFIAAAEILRPRFAVPFASGVCHLHREARAENAEIVTTDLVRSVWNERPHEGIELKLMPAGSRWSAQAGFEIAPEPEALASHVARVGLREGARLESLYAEEEGRACSFEAFEAFFGDLLKRAWLLAPLLGIRWVFRVTQKGTVEFWSVDFRRRTVERSRTQPDEYTSLITVHPAVLDQAVREMTFTNIDIAKRWHVHVRRGGVIKHLLGMVFVALYEAGYFRLRNLMTRRFLTGVGRRLPEGFDYLRLALRLLRRDRGALTEAVTDPT